LNQKTGEKPIDIAQRALEHARTHYLDVLIVDSAAASPSTRR